MATQARRINVRGVVQGIGFRPFVYRLARDNGLTGWVRNTSGDVTILVEGPGDGIERFIEDLKQNPPPQSHIESIAQTVVSPEGHPQFDILDSLFQENEYQLVSADLATCPDCQSEIFDTADRRFGYPFTNCTNCGPRFTIIEDIPYDRPRTTMRNFKMCPQCQREYDDPADRRFHAQPNACPACGPQLELVDSTGVPVPRGSLATAGELLKAGNIVAVKGLGGFLLACDATCDEAVKRLRDRKHRPSKPLAIMLRDLGAVRRYCEINDLEAEALASSAAPIVLLKMKEKTDLSPSVAPGLRHLGVMLPYTPLHHLLMHEVGRPLVMTSGNLSEEPIAKDNEEALNRLRHIADYFILHNRDIASRYDDSVVTVDQGTVRMVRRARGYAPYPAHLPFRTRPVLACGPEMKNTFCLTRDDHAFVSQHIGDMENAEALEHFENTIRLYKKLFRIEPEILACDLHPDYLPTRWAEAHGSGLPLVRVQHHHAHIVSCMAENGISSPDEKVIGVALDGTGYGSDGKIWGGEFLAASYKGFERKAHIEYLPLPGGQAAIQKPYRIAAGYLYSLFGSEMLNPKLPIWQGTDKLELEVIRQQIDRQINAPVTSSCGRLFDAVAALLGVRRQIDYEGQAAIELEAAAAETLTESVYPFGVEIRNGVRIIKVKELFQAILTDIRKEMPVPIMSAIFHNTVSNIIRRTCHDLNEETGLRKVALSGGVFQNRRLLNQVVNLLEADGLDPLLHRRLPCNDGCVSLGQAVVAMQGATMQGVKQYVSGSTCTG